MLEAALWGIVAGSSFVVGGLVALQRPLSVKWIGFVLGLGAGALIGAVAYELVDEAVALADGSGRAAIGLAGGALGAYVIAGHARGPHAEISDRRLLVAAGVDVACEAIVIVGALLGGHGVEAAVIVGVFLCGAPSAVAWTGRLRARGHAARAITALWLSLMLLSGAVALVAYAVLDASSDRTGALVLAFAAGALFVTVLAEMLPTAHSMAGASSSLATVLGFGLSFALIEVA